jgi:hypothetical protein
LRVEASSAGAGDERLGSSDLMEQACERQNLQAALKRVRRNAGSAGIDRMTVEQLPDVAQHGVGEQTLHETGSPKNSQANLNLSNRPVRTRMPGGVAGDAELQMPIKSRVHEKELARDSISAGCKRRSAVIAPARTRFPARRNLGLAHPVFQ